MAAGDKIDFFISYRSSEENWATWLAWELEEAGYTTFVQAWDFRPGGNFVAEMQKGATKCARTLAVLSPAYFESGFTKAEWYAAFANDPAGENGLLLPVRVAECDVEGLLGQVIYVNLVGLDEAAARERLLAGVNCSRAKPSVPPHFPGATSATSGIRAKPDFPKPAPAEKTHGDETQGGESFWTVNQAHEESTAAALSAAPSFFQSVRQEFPRYFRSQPVPETESAMVKFFALCEAGQVQKLFNLVRRVLFVMAADPGDSAARQRQQEVAAYLYCLAACRLVDQAKHNAYASRYGVDRHIVFVPSHENVVCAIIATSLFGGELQLRPGESGGLPQAKFVLDVPAPDGSDQIETDFERAAYAAVTRNMPSMPEMCLDTGSGQELTTDQRKWLKKRFETLKNVEFASFGLVVQGLAPTQALGFATACRGFAAKYEVPVLVPETDATAALLGMEVGDLLAEIRHFWSELRGWSGSAAAFGDQSQAQQPAETGASAMPQSSQQVHFHGPVYGSVSTGSHSAAQTGTGHTATIDHRQGADLAALVPLLQELAAEIATLSSAEKRDDLTAHIELAQHEAGKKDGSDPGRIKRALDVIKSGAEGLEQSGTIITLCNKAYNVLAPLVGLPPSPLS